MNLLFIYVFYFILHFRFPVSQLTLQNMKIVQRGCIESVAFRNIWGFNVLKHIPRTLYINSTH